MSFAETFDYKPVKDGIAQELVPVNASLASITEEHGHLQGATAYNAEVIIQDKIIHLKLEIDRLNGQKDDLNAVLAEIAAIESLTDDQKATLYYFYTIVGTSKQEFMAKMLFNHVRVLKDARISALRGDTVTPAASKAAVAKVVYQSYVIDSMRANSIMSVYRYVR